jgi:hypothetical protein
MLRECCPPSHTTDGRRHSSAFAKHGSCHFVTSFSGKTPDTTHLNMNGCCGGGHEVLGLGVDYRNSS